MTTGEFCARAEEPASKIERMTRVGVWRRMGKMDRATAVPAFEAYAGRYLVQRGVRCAVSVCHS
jgi:hypothetical protein